MINIEVTDHASLQGAAKKARVESTRLKDWQRDFEKSTASNAKDIAERMESRSALWEQIAERLECLAESYEKPE